VTTGTTDLRTQAINNHASTLPLFLDETNYLISRCSLPGFLEYEVKIPFQRARAALEAEAEKLKQRSNQLAYRGFAMTEQAMLEREKERPMGEDEELFNVELQLPTQVRSPTQPVFYWVLATNLTHLKEYAWDDKYRPRKPKYFNRVHTGYEWNKYNQTRILPFQALCFFM